MLEVDQLTTLSTQISTLTNQVATLTAQGGKPSIESAAAASASNVGLEGVDA